MPKVPNALLVVGLLNAVIAAVAPFLSSGHALTWVTIIAVAGAAASAAASYIAGTHVKKALAAAAAAIPPKLA